MKVNNETTTMLEYCFDTLVQYPYERVIPIDHVKAQCLGIILDLLEESDFYIFMFEWCHDASIIDWVYIANHVNEIRANY